MFRAHFSRGRAGMALVCGLWPVGGVRAGEVLISNWLQGDVLRYEAETGEFIGALAPAPGAGGMAVDERGILYVACETANEIRRFSLATGQPLRPFVQDDPATEGDETGGLRGPTGLTFGPDGDLYVCSFDNDSILRYDGRTGAFVDVFVGDSEGGLNGPDIGIEFGAEGDLYVASHWTDSVNRYDGVSGAAKGQFVAEGASGLTWPRDIMFLGETLLVSSTPSELLYRYDAQTGAPVGYADFFYVVGPGGMGAGPAGLVYLASAAGVVVKIDPRDTIGLRGFLVGFTGYVPQGGQDILFVPDLPCLGVAAPSPGLAGEANTITAHRAEPGGSVTFLAGTSAGLSQLPGCPGTAVGIAAARVIGSAGADEAGDASITINVPETLRGTPLYVQAVDRTACSASGALPVTFK